MNDETAREKLAMAYSGRTPEAFAAAPEEWREAWYVDTEALLPVVREIVAEELRETAEHCDLMFRRGEDEWRDRSDSHAKSTALGRNIAHRRDGIYLRDRADALHTTKAAS